MEKKKCDSSQDCPSCGQSATCSEDEKKAHQDKDGSGDPLEDSVQDHGHER